MPAACTASLLPPSCPRGELPGTRHGDVQHFGDPAELKTEDIVQDQGRPLRQAQLFHDQQHRRADGLVHEYRLRRVRLSSGSGSHGPT